jgi:hypothetical protein
LADLTEDEKKKLEMKKLERIKKEIKRLNSILSKMDPKRKKSVLSLIENAAFMAITLQDLQQTMNAEGVISKYQNGENQWGTKKSPEVEIYNTMVKNHASIIKQLTDLLPVLEPKEEDDGFEAFVNKR